MPIFQLFRRFVSKHCNAHCAPHGRLLSPLNRRRPLGTWPLTLGGAYAIRSCSAGLNAPAPRDRARTSILSRWNSANRQMVWTRAFLSLGTLRTLQIQMS